MNRNTEIQKKVEATMESLSGIERQEPAPFFYTRVQARLRHQKKNVWEQMTRTVTRPAFAFFSIAIIVLVNSFVVVSFTNERAEPERTDVAIAEEYRSTDSFYDLENIMP